MAFRLPPLNTLRFFESAGRTLSFKHAAEELHVTPSAVSHGIQALEDWLGAPLFVRGSRSLGLTIAGEAYLPYVRDALTLLARGTEQVPGQTPRGTLSVSVVPTFAQRWLVPNLPRFQQRHPEIAITLDTAHRRVTFPLDGVDLAIRMGQGPFPGLFAVKLVTEQLFPVCSPDLARKEPELRLPEDLRRATILHVTTITEDWAAWLKASGNADIPSGRALRFDTIQLALEAAMQVLGVAIGRRPLIDDDLAAGRLVKLFDPVILGSTSYWLVGASESMARPEVAAFRDWMVAELVRA